MHKKLLFLLFLFLVFSFSGNTQTRSSDIDKYLLLQVKNNVLQPSDIANYKITDQHISSTSNVQHIYFRQSYNGIEIIDTESSVHIKDGTFLQSHHNFIKNVDQKIKTPSPAIGEIAAIQGIAQQMGYAMNGALRQLPYQTSASSKKIYSNAGISTENIPVKLVYKKLPYGKLVAAWEISIREISGKNWYNFFVDASTGEILTKNNWSLTCDAGHIHEHDTATAFAKVHPAPTHPSVSTSSVLMEDGTYNVFPVPLASPHDGDRSIVTDPHNTIASPFGWHDTNGATGAEFTTTRGNNVNAYEDGDNPGYQPDGGTDLIFDYPFDPVFSFANQSEDAVITNLFYWSNVIHDVLYLYGLDESSGNFQVNNYGNGGIGNDEILAEAQDASGTCNANFQTPPDGSSGIMQMYTCGARDGDVDNLVIVHEYGHGISIRLTGGPSNSGCLFNDEQMGEGWSDWYGAVLTIEEGDLGTDLRPVGNWLFEQGPDGPGIRDFPYTTDLSQDPRTYDFIKTTFGPHPLGSTWAAMLWEMTWGLIDEHGFDPDIYNGTGGNNIAIALVTEGLKLQPCNPGFVDGRDAILAADAALYGGANQCIIWDAFAKRGLGQSADQGSSFDRTDGTEAFDSPSTNMNTPETPFCISEESITLTGGIPSGGVYSGPGVTDNGDGNTYIFDPASAGIGIHTITYTLESECTEDGNATDTIEVRNDTPIIECQDITIALDEEGQATIIPQDVVTGFLPGEGYTIDQTGTFDPIDFTGTSVPLGDDQLSSQLPIGFDFIFYGETYNTFQISSNGFLTFGDDNFDSGCCQGDLIPSPGTPSNLIAFAWDDLFPPGNGSVTYTTLGTAPNRTLLVSFEEIPFCCNSTGEVTAQVQLYEGSNRIEIHSTDVEGVPMTQGIENIDGSDGIAVDGRNSTAFSITNDYVAFIPNEGGFPDNCGNETTVTIDIDTFDCTNIGENTVIATVTDSEGNTATCTAVVTVISEIEVTFELSETTFCVDQDPITLEGGLPVGGTYSGDGVTDDGNGETFTFDPSGLEPGEYSITYTGSDSCDTVGEASVTVEVLPAIPEIVCEDITVNLDETGIITIDPIDILGSSTTSGGGSTLYALNRLDAVNSIARYEYDSETDAITIDPTFSLGTGLNTHFGLDNDPTSSDIYIAAAISNNDTRQLFLIDLENPTDPLTFVTDIISVTGNNNIQAMTFASDGTLYFVFNGGEINSYDLDTNTMSALAFVESAGAVGMTYDYDNNRLIYATASSPVSLFGIDITSGTVTSLFSFFTPGTNSGCSAQGIEYVGDNKVIAGSTFSCNIIYTLDLSTEETELLLNPTGSFPNIKDLMLLGGLPVDNCSGEALTFSVTPSTFDCSNLGENTVVVTATDSNGNTSECTAIVTITADDIEVTFELNETTFCADQDPVTLGGGLPLGGTYSGDGVTDDGNGETFTFDPSGLEPGEYVITYNGANTCGITGEPTVTVEVLPAIPEIVCQDITVNLDETGIITINPIDILGSSTTSGGGSTLYALNRLDAVNSIARYEYDSETDAITIDPTFSLGTGLNTHFGLDNDPTSSDIYIAAAISNNDTRQLFLIDLENPTDPLTFVTDIISVTGNNNIQAMTFASDGTLYFVFNGGEINSYDLDTDTMSALAFVESAGAVGMTYDYDNNRLIYATSSGPVSLFGIDITSGTVTSLFNFSTPGGNSGCSAQGIEYVGDNKVIAGSTFSCDIIYTVDLSTEETELLLNPTGSFPNIKDLMLLGSLPVDNCSGEALTFSVSPSTLDCSNLGENTVVVTATDSNGNTSECTAIVTVEDNTAPVLDCVPGLVVTLDETGSAIITIDDLVSSPVEDNCDDTVDIVISQTEFSCLDLNATIPTNIINNGSFENGLDSWESVIINGTDGGPNSCQEQWRVEEDSSTICCCLDDLFPTDQNFAAFTSFDGEENSIYQLSQEFSVPFIVNPEEFNATLSFDWLGNFNFAGEPRVFTVDLVDTDGDIISTVFTEDINGDTIIDISPVIDISEVLIPLSGQAIILRIQAIIPESFVGPSKSMIDNIVLTADSNATEVTITATDGNGNTSECIVPITIEDPTENCSLSTDENELAQQIALFPNPADTSFTLSWNPNNAIEQFQIFEITGKKVYETQVDASILEQQIDVSTYAKGVYLIKATTSTSKTYIRKLIVR